MRRRHLLTSAAGIGLISLAGCISIGQARDESAYVSEEYQATDIGEIHVETVMGDITITPGDGQNIDIEGRKAAATTSDLDSVELDVEVDGDTMLLEVEAEDIDSTLFGIQTRPDPKMDLDIKLPAGISVSSIETVTGSVSITDLVGETTIEVITGDTTVTDHDGHVDVDSTTGAVLITEVDGDVTARTTTGDIEVRDVDGDLTVETTTGTVTTDSITGEEKHR